MSGSLAVNGSAVSGSKRSISEALSDVFGPATPAQMEILESLGKLDLDGDKTTWSMEAVRTCGLMEFVTREQVAGRTFMAPVVGPADGNYSVAFMAATGWRFFVVEQDLVASGHGLLVKVVGSTEHNGMVFPLHGGIVIGNPLDKFLVAKRQANGVETTLQAFIKEAMRGHVGPNRAGGGVLGSAPNLGIAGGSDCVKKATLASVLDINGEVRVVFNKEGGSVRMRQWAALLREWEYARVQLFLGLDYDATIEQIRDAMLSESDRVMVQGDAMFSLSRLNSVRLLEAWMNPEAFRCFLLLDLPVSNWKHSLLDFIEPECSAWTRDCALQGSRNLARAVENFGNFQRVMKGEPFRDCMAPIRVLWEDPGRFVERYQNEFLHFWLERMIRSYAQEQTKTQGKMARAAGGLALGGQGESVALLNWCVAEFVALVRGGTLEPAPHERFYASEQWARVVNKPVAGGAKGKSGGSGGGPGPGKVGGSPGGGGAKAPPYHKDGLCLWWLGGKLGLKNQKGALFECKTPEGENAVVHTVLSKVKLSTIKVLLKDAKFTAVCSSDSLKAAILAKALEDKHRFKAE